jgi:putative Mg2+ transporter-C (MgtC) family protein
VIGAAADGEVAVSMTLSGAKIADAANVFADVGGVAAVLHADDDTD